MKKPILILAITTLLFSCKKEDKKVEKLPIQATQIVTAAKTDNTQPQEEPTEDVGVVETNKNNGAIIGHWVLENSDGVGWADVNVNANNTLDFWQGPCQGTLKYAIEENETSLVFVSSDCSIDIGDSTECEGKKIGICYLNSDDKLVLEMNTKEFNCGEMTSGKFILKRSDY
jgi:hypothetical protein